jgi:hypothetical protein
MSAVSATRARVAAVAIGAAALAGCGSAASPSSPTFAAGVYQLRVTTFNLSPGSPVCGALPGVTSYLATLQFDGSGDRFSGRGTGDSAADAVEITMQVAGDSIVGTISGSFVDHAPGLADADRVTVAFPATGGAPVGFAGKFTPATSGGNGVFSGQPTVTVPGPTPLVASCRPGELLWLLSK